MIRILIEWTFISPLLRIVSGILKVEVVEYGNRNILLFKCKVKKERGSTSYTSLDGDKIGVPGDLFEVLRHSIESMIHSYYNGMLLNECDYHWIENSISDPISFKEWAVKHGIDSSKYIQNEERRNNAKTSKEYN